MKTLLKSAAAVCLVLTFIFATAAAATAETYYVYDGYRYRDADWNANTILFSGTEENAAELVIPDKIATKTIVGIDDYAFYNNEVLTNIDLSQANHLTSIGVGAFRGCKKLEKLTVPAGVQHLSEYMLTDCSSLKSLEINMSPTSIPDEMCNRCYSLETVNIPESVTEIRRYAFGKCTSLKYVEIPASVESIAQSAFSNDPNLTLGVWYGSVGYDYAIAQNIPYILLDGVKLGDVNGDGYVNINDVTHIQRHLAELESLEGIYLHAADTNQDGTLDISDATTLQMYLAEYDIPYPIGGIMTQ